MSLDNVKNTIKEFLKNDTPEVLCLHGKWGVGKTYLWKQYYDELSKNKQVKLKKYSYVSLFGVESIQDLKLAVLSQSDNFFNKVIGQGSTIAKGIPLVDHQKAITGLGLSFIEESVICIDDIERKSGLLRMEDILGFICYLRDEKNCKVVMLQNSDALEEQNADNLKKYFEKVIDYNITLETTPEEAVDIALDDIKGMESIRENIIKLRINNIRIIKKIQNHANQILLHLPEGKYQKETIKSALSTLCLYCDSHYAPDSNKPTIEFIMRYNSWSTKDESESDKKLKNIISKYGYSHTDNLDKEIFNFIKNGYINVSAFEKAALELNKQYQTGTVENDFRNAWSPYHNSLQDNTDEFLNGLFHSFKKAVHTISPTNLNSTYTLFKELGDEKRAKEILEFYIKKHCNDLEQPFDLDKAWIFDEPHPEVKKSFEEAFERYKQNNPIPFDEAFERISENKGNRDDEDVLKNADFEEFYKFYKKLDNKSISPYILEVLKFEKYSDDSVEIGNKARKALEKLASEFPLNKLRLKRFGIIAQSEN